MDFEIIIQECSLSDPLPKLLKEFRYVEQNLLSNLKNRELIVLQKNQDEGVNLKNREYMVLQNINIESTYLPILWVQNTKILPYLGQ